jgi:hypothetical protein
MKLRHLEHELSWDTKAAAYTLLKTENELELKLKAGITLLHY